MIDIYFHLNEEKNNFSELSDLIKHYEAKVFYYEDKNDEYSNIHFFAISKYNSVCIKFSFEKEDYIKSFAHKISQFSPIKLVGESVYNRNKTTDLLTIDYFNNIINNTFLCKNCNNVIHVSDDENIFCPYCGNKLCTDAYSPLKICPSPKCKINYKEDECRYLAFLPKYNNCKKCGTKLISLKNIYWFDFQSTLDFENGDYISIEEEIDK